MTSSSEKIEIWQAKLADLDFVCELNQKINFNSWVRGHFEAELKKGATLLLVASKAATPLGYILFSKLSAVEGEILQIGVLEEARCQGVGRMLMHQLLVRLCAAEMHSIFLEVRASNLPALKLYLSQGFEKKSVRKNYYSNPSDDAILMTKELRVIPKNS